MSGAGGLTADELLGSLRRRCAALPAEIGTFIVFEACEAALRAPPAVVRAAAVRIDQEGGIELLPGAASASEQACTRSLHALLTRVLLAARPGPTPALLRLVEQGPSTGSWSREALRDDLEAELVPLNRLASRRVLARLLREVAADGARDRPPAPRPPSYGELDDELGALLSDTSPVEPFRRDEPTLRDEVLLVEDVGFEERDDFHERPTAKVSLSEVWEVEPSRVPSVPARMQEDVHVHEDAQAQAHENVHVHEDMHVRNARRFAERLAIEPVELPRRRGLWLGVGLVVLAGGLAAVVGWLRPDVLSRLRGEAVEAPPEAAAAAPVEAPKPRAGALVLHVEPPRSQVLLAEGTAPLEIGGVAVGTAQEFVAIAEGRAPSRALIAPEDSWEQTDGGPFYELAMQTGPLEQGQTPRLGETLLPRSMQKPTRRDGRVRVVTTPRGAQVYRVVGFAPEARIDGVPLDTPVELRVFRDGYEPARVTLTPEDWDEEASERPVIEREVRLKKAARHER